MKARAAAATGMHRAAAEVAMAVVAAEIPVVVALRGVPPVRGRKPGVTAGRQRGSRRPSGKGHRFGLDLRVKP